MPTHDYVIDNATGSTIRADLNNALSAIVTNNSDSSEPATKYAYMWWADTTTGLLKIRNSSNNGWVTLFQLDGTLTLEDGSNSAPGLSFRDDTNTGIFSSGADNLDITTGGTTRVNVSSTGINVTGTVIDDGATHDGDVTFTGASANIVFDKSANALEFDDNAKAVFGSSSDLEIFHNASDSVINDAGTGSIKLQLGGATKAEVVSGGVTVSGNVSATTFVGDIDANNGDFDGTLEADAITVGGVALNEVISDTVGAMVSSNTESNITVTYQDSDNTLDFSVSTLNQDTTGTAAIATTVTTADESSDTTCFPLFVTAATGNLAPKTGSNLAFNSSSGALAATAFVGDGSGLTNLPPGSDTYNTNLKLTDDTKLQFGGNFDLQLYHENATSSNFIYSDIGDLNICVDSGSKVVVQSGLTGNHLAEFNFEGAVELLYNGSPKFATTSTGASLAGNLAFTNGNGVDFSATSDAAGHSSSVLTDYEEGTWTPTLEFNGSTSGITYSARRHGTYTKIGRQVTLHFRFELTSKGSASSSAESSISGLPYAIANTMNAQSGGSDITQGEASGICAFFNDVNSSDNISSIFFLANDNTQELEIRFTSGPQDQTDHMLTSNFDNDTDIAGSITYNTTS